MGTRFENNLMGLPTPESLRHEERQVPYTLVGDEAFPLKPYLMRPYPRAAGLDYPKVFNYRLTRARRVLENAFGILANRWRILRRPFKASLENTNSIIASRLALHNFLLTNNESRWSYAPPHLIDHEDDMHPVADGEWRADGSRMECVGHRLASNAHSQRSAHIRAIYT